MKSTPRTLEIAHFLALTVGAACFAGEGLLFAPPVLAQLPSTLDVGDQVYQQLPTLPRENQYFNTQTNSVAKGNTLVSRLLRYHVYVKGRPPNQRLDWKLTLADYLGVNELMEESRYPSRDVLQVNPIEGDRAALRRLNRAQRDALVQALVSQFTPTVPAPTSPTPVPQATPTQPAKPARSGAQLLLP